MLRRHRSAQPETGVQGRQELLHRRPLICYGKPDQASSGEPSMDIVSHGLWGALAFGRSSRPSFRLAFVIGLSPDLLSFGILWTAATLGLSPKPDFSHGTPPESTIPD